MRFSLPKSEKGIYQRVMRNEGVSNENRMPRIIEDVTDMEFMRILDTCCIEEIKKRECSKIISQSFQFNTDNDSFFLDLRYIKSSDGLSICDNIEIQYSSVGFTKYQLENLAVLEKNN